MAASLIALNAFAAVARRLSFGRAAEDLGLTQSAVSRHVQGLERDLGILLFVRHGRTISLTEQGRTLFGDVDAGLLRVRSGIDAVRLRHPALRVSLLPSFATHWLVPRMQDFARQHPGIELKLDPGYRLADLGADEADVAIRYGRGTWPGLVSDMLIEEDLAPVGSPMVAASLLGKPFDPAAVTLLDSLGNFEWPPLAVSMGFALPGIARQSRLQDYNIVIQAAIEGQGIAVGRRSLIQRPLAAGDLVRLSDGWHRCGLGHHLVTLPGRKDEPSIRAFRRWLQHHARVQASTMS